jgi:hypothetical protein
LNSGSLPTEETLSPIVGDCLSAFSTSSNIQKVQIVLKLDDVAGYKKVIPDRGLD